MGWSPGGRPVVVAPACPPVIPALWHLPTLWDLRPWLIRWCPVVAPWCPVVPGGRPVVPGGRPVIARWWPGGGPGAVHAPCARPPTPHPLPPPRGGTWARRSPGRWWCARWWSSPHVCMHVPMCSPVVGGTRPHSRPPGVGGGWRGGAGVVGVPLVKGRGPPHASPLGPAVYPPGAPHRCPGDLGSGCPWE